jgi:hypothetical protein
MWGNRAAKKEGRSSTFKAWVLTTTFASSLRKSFKASSRVRWALRGSDRYRLFKLGVISFGIENAKLKPFFSHALSEGRGESRFSDSGASRDQHAAAVRVEAHIPVLAFGADANGAAMSGQAFCIARANPINEFDDAGAALFFQDEINQLLETWERIGDSR